MSFEITTKMKNLSLADSREAVVVMTITLTPRGSGNRNTVRRLARQFKRHELLGQHIAKVVCGTTSLHVHLRPSLACWSDLQETVRQAKEAQAANDPSQMILPLAGMA